MVFTYDGNFKEFALAVTKIYTLQYRKMKFRNAGFAQLFRLFETVVARINHVRNKYFQRS